MLSLLFKLGYSAKASALGVECHYPRAAALLKTKIPKKLLANVDVSLYMIKRPRFTAAHSLAKFSLFAIIVAGVIFAIIIDLPVDSSNGNLQKFEVKKGESVKTIANNLKSAGLVRSPLYFRLLVRQKNLVLEAGIYYMSPAIPPSQIPTLFTEGRMEDKKITIPEGFRSEQIAEAAGLPVKEFLLASKDLEGQLFPDTYFVKEGITSIELVKIMHDNFLKKVGDVDRETLILASLVERETRGDAEKPIVAGILKKRLAAGWPLELDATVQYFLGKPGNWWANTTLLDRKIKSSYNTYLNKGLPPGPIGNPGLASIKAVENSIESPYWYYLHDKSGTIHYGATLEEHNQNIAKYIN